MPGIVTHTYFAKDIYIKLKPKIKRRIDQDTYLVFSKGPDIFRYQYLNILRHKELVKFGYHVHDNKTKKFLLEYVNHIVKYRLEKNKEVVGSLYGTITHYVLDSKTHPLIYYQTNQNSYKHKEMELLIDLYILEKREEKKPRKIKIDKLLFPNISYSLQLRNLLNRLYQVVYGKEKMGNYYLSCLKQINFIVRYLKMDRYRIKLRIYRLLSKIPFIPKKIVLCSYANNLRKKIGYVNFEHEKWYHPCNKNEASTDCFFDLYNEAKEKTLEIINEVHSVLVGEKDIKELEKVLDNTSCITGKDCDIKRPMKYFKNNI